MTKCGRQVLHDKVDHEGPLALTYRTAELGLLSHPQTGQISPEVPSCFISR